MVRQPIKNFQLVVGASYMLADVTPTDDEDVILMAGQPVVIVTQMKGFTLIETEGRHYLIDAETLVDRWKP